MSKQAWQKWVGRNSSLAREEWDGPEGNGLGPVDMQTQAIPRHYNRAVGHEPAGHKLGGLGPYAIKMGWD
ncbi:hypothetical protein Tco_0506736 [Tanacetum coccineum]